MVTSATLIPRSVIFGNPSRVNPHLSPDGARLAYVAPHNGVLNIWVGSIDGSDAVPITASDRSPITNYLWTHDSRYILYALDSDGNEDHHLYRVDPATGETLDLTPFEGVKVYPNKISRRRPDEMLIMMNRESADMHDAYLLNIGTGELELVAKNPGNILGFVADDDLQVRAAFAMRADSGRVLMTRSDASHPFRPFISWDPDDAANSTPLFFSGDGTHLYLLDSRGFNTTRLLSVDVESGLEIVIAQDEFYDVTDIEADPETMAIQMVGYTRERLEWDVIEPAMADHVERLRAIHHGDFRISSRTDDDRLWVVTFNASDDPLRYYLYDTSTGEVRHLFTARPDLEQYQLAVMEPIQFTARDGLVIHGYITFPPGVTRENLPMVLNVHGGPWVRDTWGYDGEAQWLANRGYVCLQVNYRGSTGFGKDFVMASSREWGGKMHDDLIDAVRWAVERGYADPERVAIYGGSYGGYASLCGATLTPDEFSCAVSIVGPSNLITFINTIPSYWKPFLATMYARVGNPETDAEFLQSRSPLFHVDRIRIPMLIAHGANDPRVKQDESEQIVAAMREKNIPHEYLLFTDEGHGFAKPQNRMTFYTAAEKFLAEHLGGRYEE